MDTICRTRNTLTEIISLHQRNNIREKSSYVDVYLKHIEEEEEPSDTSIVSEGRKCLLSSLEDIILGSEGILFAFDALLYCLAKNQNVQVKMREEIYNVTQR